MAAAARADADNAVDARRRRLFGEADSGGVVEVEQAMVLHQRCVDGGIADRSDDDAHAMAPADFQMGAEFLAAEGGRDIDRKRADLAGGCFIGAQRANASVTELSWASSSARSRQ